METGLGIWVLTGAEVATVARVFGELAASACLCKTLSSRRRPLFTALKSKNDFQAVKPLFRRSSEAEASHSEPKKKNSAPREVSRNSLIRGGVARPSSDPGRRALELCSCNVRSQVPSARTVSLTSIPVPSSLSAILATPVVSSCRALPFTASRRGGHPWQWHATAQANFEVSGKPSVSLSGLANGHRRCQQPRSGGEGQTSTVRISNHQHAKDQPDSPGFRAQ